jgi:hypothetical protein
MMRFTGVVLALGMCLMPYIAVAQTPYCIVTAPVPVGDGPLSRISNLPLGWQADWGYMEAMYQQNMVIAEIADIGSRQSGDAGIRILSHKIAMERIDMNNRLMSWYRIFTNRLTIPYSNERADILQQALLCTNRGNFDCRYTGMVISLMQQSFDAARWATWNSDIPELRDQAWIVGRTNQNEIEAFRSWQQTGSVRR